MRAYFARRRRLSGDLRPHFCAARRQDRRLSIPAALVSRWCTLLVALLCIVSSVPLTAQETVTYTYDALGRLTTVDHGGNGPNACTVAGYTYDRAANRNNVTVLKGTPITLLAGQSMASTDGRFTLAMQTDGNLVLYGPTGAMWSTATNGGSDRRMTMQCDGNLVVYNGTNQALWASGTSGNPESRLALQNDGNLVIYNSADVAIWATNTVYQPLTLSPTTLPNGTVGAAYNQTITATGGTSPYSFTTSAGALPTGLMLSSAGILSGTPTTAATYSFTVQATDSTTNHIGSQSYTATIAAAPSGPVANPDSASTTVCGTVSVNVIANDTGTPPLTLTAIVSSTKGTATVQSSTNVSYTAFGTAGTGVVKYTVSDGHGATATGTLSVTISGGVCP